MLPTTVIYICNIKFGKKYPKVTVNNYILQKIMQLIQSITKSPFQCITSFINLSTIVFIIYNCTKQFPFGIQMGAHNY